jgi:hypothetical protein
MVIDAVRNWMQQDMNRNVFDRVVFSSKANSSLVEKLMHNSFPLYLTTNRDSGGSFTAAQEEGGREVMQNGIEPQSLHNGSEPAHTGTGVVPCAQQNGTEMTQEKIEPRHNGCTANGNVEEKDRVSEEVLSTEDLLESLDAIQDENMKTFEDLMKKLEGISPEPDRLKLDTPLPENQDIFSKSLPSHDFGLCCGPPSGRASHNRSHSGDHILNPERVESDV